MMGMGTLCYFRTLRTLLPRRWACGKAEEERDEGGEKGRKEGKSDGKRK
jgi:hypothetical protein